MYNHHQNQRNSSSYPISEVSKRATQRQWNATHVSALTRQIDSTLASQQRELPLCVEISNSVSSSSTSKNVSPSPQRFAMPLGARSHLPASVFAAAVSPPPLISSSSKSTSSSSSSASPVRLQWTAAPSLTALKQELREQQQQQQQKQQQQQQQSRPGSMHISSKNNNNSNDISLSTTEGISQLQRYFGSQQEQLQFHPRDHHHQSPAVSPPTNLHRDRVQICSGKESQNYNSYFVAASPFPDLLSNSARMKNQTTSSSTTTSLGHHHRREKVKFENTDPSFFLPVRGGSDHAALDSISVQQIRDAIEECPSRERRVAAHKALKGTVLDRQSTVFGRSSNGTVNHSTNNGSVIISPCPSSSSSVFLGRDQLLSDMATTKKQPSVEPQEIVALSPMSVPREHQQLPQPQPQPQANHSYFPNYATANTSSIIVHDDDNNIGEDNDNDDELDAALAEACRELEQQKRVDKKMVLPSGLTLEDVL